MSNLFQAFGGGSPTLVMLSGLPGSGKSTFREFFSGGVILSTDDILEDFAQRTGRTYDDVFADHIKEAEVKMQAAFRYALNQGDHIVIDRTNLSAKKRRGVLSNVPSEYRKVVIVFGLPNEEEWERRLDSRPGKLGSRGFLNSMRENFQRPTLAEGWDMIFSVEQP